MEMMGVKLRRKRLRLGLTLDELAGRTGISKPYLSLIETGRVPNPPSDEKLKRLEQSLGFPTGELLTQAHLHRTPKDVRAMLQRLLSQNKNENGGPHPANGKSSATATIDLDDAYLSGALHQFVETSASNVDRVETNRVPVINRVSAGYPQDFTDLNYPKG